MKKILVSGATGNVGRAVIDAFSAEQTENEVLAGVHKPDQFPEDLRNKVHQVVHLDLEEPETFGPGLQGINSLFLLRPPQLSDAKKFEPLIQAAQDALVNHIVFLSVQGADTNTVIPHHKIEQIILGSNIPYTFLRPAYFLQNFLTSLHQELVEKNRVFLPTGKAKFTLVDVRDIGAFAAKVMLDPPNHLNQAYDLTNEELLDFGTMAKILSKELGRPIRYESPNPVRFFAYKRQEGTPAMFILVMIMLHYLPRFSKPPQRTNHIQEVTGQKPIGFAQFVQDHRNELS